MLIRGHHHDKWHTQGLSSGLPSAAQGSEGNCQSLRHQVFTLSAYVINSTSYPMPPGSLGVGWSGKASWRRWARAARPRRKRESWSAGAEPGLPRARRGETIQTRDIRLQTSSLETTVRAVSPVPGGGCRRM